MSQVIIAGDTSGTITLQAPAVSGSSVLTLPATTATLATLTTPSFASTIGVGGATASASGAGISFPATQSASSDANTLDDYEEGSWTPVASAASGSLTAYSSNGTYTKIGRIVTLFGSITTTTVGTASGTLNFTGVPFNTLGGEQYNGVSREVISTGANHFANISNTSGLLQSITGGGITWVNGYAYKFTVTYQV
jgi:hypothetical protein